METNMQTVISQAVEQSNAFTIAIWYLIGAALVFFMQCGFAMVETGFTRAKNAGNIIMKNLMDFCIGTVMFIFLGFGLMMSENYLFGLIGVPNLQIFTNFNDFPWSSFVFNLVFCATAATIVSGAMAERTKFISYCIYSGLISLVVYPIEAGWVWNSQGWLAQLGFVDFAGSACIHTVGGISAIIGAAMVGPRIGKYTKEGKPRAIPGHSLTLGALGVFILWFGWYGFNGAAATDVTQLAQIFATTTVAPAAATCATMIYTWIKNGKPDVSMSLNGSLAGLVAITAGCDCVNVWASAVIGLISGFAVVFGIEFVDKVLKIDDPVGAVGVHFCNGFLGTILTGVFASNDWLSANGMTRAHFIAIQLLGAFAVILWGGVTITITFLIIKKTIGLRVTREEELQGLDLPEHGLVSAYADFQPIFATMSAPTRAGLTSVSEKRADIDDAVPVVLKTPKTPVASDVKLTKIEIFVRQECFESLKQAMLDIGITGMTVTNILGCGVQKGKPSYYRGAVQEITLHPRVQVEIVVSKIPVKTVIDAAKSVMYTGHTGDGKIFVYDVENVIKVRTGEEGVDALQDEEQY